MERARPAQPGDLPGLTALGERGRAEVAARRGGPQLLAEVLAGRSVTAGLAAALVDPRRLVVVGEIDGATLGLGVVGGGAPPRTAGVATVEALYVDPGARGVGLGEAMLEAMTDWAVAAGCTSVDAVALPGSREAKSFFETHGLVARALVMHRALPPGPAGPRQ